MSDTQKVYLELFFKSGRTARIYTNVDNGGMDNLSRIVYDRGLATLKSIELRKVYIDGRLTAAYSVDTSSLESVSLHVVDTTEDQV